LGYLSGSKLAGRATPLARNPWRDLAQPKAATTLALVPRAGAHGFGNNVDHRRLCHASRCVAALLEGGVGAVTWVSSVEHAGLILVIGSNPPHIPVAATWMKNAAKRGAKKCASTRVTGIGKHAWRASVQT
jgi:anaerobic selenocysteine-containing dehydrogenase